MVNYFPEPDSTINIMYSETSALKSTSLYWRCSMDVSHLSMSYVMLYKNKPFQPQPVWVDVVGVSQSFIFSWNPVTLGNSPYTSYVYMYMYYNTP